MPTYMSLIKLTHQGVTSIGESPARLDAAREAMRAFGVEMKDFYLGMGQYDIIVVTEAPDDAAVAKALLSIAASGNVRSETMRVFREEEYREIVHAVQPAAAASPFAAFETIRQKLAESIEEVQRALHRE